MPEEDKSVLALLTEKVRMLTKKVAVLVGNVTLLHESLLETDRSIDEVKRETAALGIRITALQAEAKLEDIRHQLDKDCV